MTLRAVRECTNCGRSHRRRIEDRAAWCAACRVAIASALGEVLEEYRERVGELVRREARRRP